MVGKRPRGHEAELPGMYAVTADRMELDVFGSRGLSEEKREFVEAFPMKRDNEAATRGAALTRGPCGGIARTGPWFVHAR